MKAKKWAGLILMLCIIAGFAFAEAQEEAEKTEATPARTPRRMSTDRARGMAGRDQMYRQRMAQQAEVHAAAMKELEAIKKIAEEENAAKTVEAIQALIDRKTAEYKTNVERVEKARRDRAEQIQERTKKADDGDDDDDDDDDADEDDDD